MITKAKLLDKIRSLENLGHNLTFYYGNENLKNNTDFKKFLNALYRMTDTLHLMPIAGNHKINLEQLLNITNDSSEVKDDKHGMSQISHVGGNNAYDQYDPNVDYKQLYKIEKEKYLKLKYQHAKNEYLNLKKVASQNLISM